MVMRRTRAAAAGVAVILMTGSAASAGVFTDDLSKCLVRSATPEDNEVLTHWIFSAMSVHPTLKPYTSLTDAQRAGFDQQAAGLFERLLLNDCRKESVQAVKAEGTKAIETSFELLGSVAMRQILSDRGVAAGMGNLTHYLDRSKWESFGAEAGATPAK